MSRPSFTPRILGDVTVLVSSGAEQRPSCDLLQALAEHGPVTRGSLQSQHRTPSGTLVVMHSGGSRDVLLLTPSELRAMRRSR